MALYKFAMLHDIFFFFQSGKQCLCRYMLPSCFSKGRFSHSMEFPETSVSQGMKIVGLADAVEGRINVTVNKGQVIRLVGLLLSLLLKFRFCTL